MNFKRIEGKYLHGINLNDWYPCWNFTLSKRLVSANFIPLVDPSFKSQRRIEDISIEEFKISPGCFTGTLTPRALWYVWAAAIIRNGGHVGIGQIDTNWVSKDEMERIKKLGDIEIQLEQIRREINPEACSRLGCLWIAEDNPDGAANIRGMLGADVYLAQVHVPIANKFAKADRRWFDVYCDTQDRKYAENYWTEQKFGSVDAWEYLVEGIIESTNDEDIRYIKANGKSLIDACKKI